MAVRTISDDLLRRVEAEYREMPGLRLTFAQAQRLWSLDRESCEAVLNALVEAHVLARIRSGNQDVFKSAA